MKIVKYFLIGAISGLLIGLVFAIGIGGISCTGRDCEQGVHFCGSACEEGVETCFGACVGGTCGAINGFFDCSSCGLSCFPGLIKGCKEGGDEVGVGLQDCGEYACEDCGLACEYCTGAECNIKKVPGNPKAKNIFIFSIIIGTVIGFVYGLTVTIQEGRQIRMQKKQKEIEIQRPIKLFAAVKNDDITTLRDLLENWPDVDLDKKYDDTVPRNVLHIAAAGKDKELVSILLEHGASVNSISSENKTPLDYAQDEEIVALLKSQGAKTKNELDDEEEKRFIAMKMQRQQEEKKAEEEKEKAERRRLLNEDFLTAIYRGDAQEVESYITAGADVNYADVHGNTPLIAAIRKHNADIVRLLLKKGADPNQPLTGERREEVEKACYERDGFNLADFIPEFRQKKLTAKDFCLFVKGYEDMGRLLL